MKKETAIEFKGLTERAIDPLWMKDWYEGLTYRTGNALGQDLTEHKILNALNDLKTDDIRITNLLIDDNWQSLDKTEESQ